MRTARLRSIIRLAICTVMFFGGALVACAPAKTSSTEVQPQPTDTPDKQAAKKPILFGPNDKITWYLTEWNMLNRAITLGLNMPTDQQDIGCISYIPRSTTQLKIRYNHCRISDGDGRYFVISGNKYLTKDSEGTIVLATNMDSKPDGASELALQWPAANSSKPYRWSRFVEITPNESQAGAYNYRLISELVPKTDSGKKPTSEYWQINVRDTFTIDDITKKLLLPVGSSMHVTYSTLSGTTRIEGELDISNKSEITLHNSCGRMDSTWDWSWANTNDQRDSGSNGTSVDSGLIVSLGADGKVTESKKWPPCFGI